MSGRRALRPLLLLPLLACADAEPAPVAAAVVAPGWTLGPASACAAPADGPNWVDRSVMVGDPSPAAVWDHDGVLGLLPWGEGHAALYAVGLNTLEAHALGDGALLAAYEFPARVRSISAADLDDDGAIDLVAEGGELRVIWSVGRPEEAVEVIPPGAVPHQVNDLTLADLDGDGLDELLLFPIDPAYDPAAMRPEVVWNRGGRIWEARAPLGPADGWGQAFDVRVGDFNGDAAPDVYVCNDEGPNTAPNRLLYNDGAGQLIDGAAQGLDLSIFCMGTAHGDFDADGRLDAWVGSLDQPYLLLADEKGGHYDATLSRGLQPYPSGQMAWGGALVDLDNDGRTDLINATADFPEAGAGLFPVQAHLQGEDGRLTEVGAALGLPQATGARSVLAQDWNGDGMVDLLISDMMRSPWLFVSEGCTAGAWLAVEAPSGSRVTVVAGGQRRVALASREPTFSALGPAVAHFGLGDVDVVEEITIEAPYRAPTVLAGPIAARRRVRWVPDSL